MALFTICLAVFVWIASPTPCAGVIDLVNTAITASSQHDKCVCYPTTSLASILVQSINELKFQQPTHQKPVLAASSYTTPPLYLQIQVQP